MSYIYVPTRSLGLFRGRLLAGGPSGLLTSSFAPFPEFCILKLVCSVEKNQFFSSSEFKGNKSRTFSLHNLKRQRNSVCFDSRGSLISSRSWDISFCPKCHWQMRTDRKAYSGKQWIKSNCNFLAVFILRDIRSGRAKYQLCTKSDTVSTACSLFHPNMISQL